MDGSYLLFASARYGVPNIFKHAADRRGGAERLIESARLQQPGPPAPDGAILFSEAVPNRGRDIMRFWPGTRSVEPVVATEANEEVWDFSPDGRWIAYTSDESGQFEVYVRPYPRTDAGQWKVSTSGGRQPLWSRNGKQLFYRDYGGAILAVSVPAGPRFSPGPQVTLLPANNLYRGSGAAVSGATYSESIDGSRFLMIKAVETSGPPSLIVATSRGLGLWESARLFGLLNLSMADGYIGSWDSKYHYSFWRPVTAIHEAAADGNPQTLADPTWTPLQFTYPIPDHDSAHAVQGGAAAEALKQFFGTDRVPFEACSLTLPAGQRCSDPSAVYRSYTTFTQAAEENAASRVYVGIHFRRATEEGVAHGRQIARRAARLYLRPGD